MKILILAAIDAMNLAIENIVRELINRNHQIDIFAQNMAEGSIRMFKVMDVPIYPMNELTDSRIKTYDFAFCCEDAVPALRHSDIYIFSYNFIPDTWNGLGSDFMFTMARDRKILWNEDCAKMVVGDAKNDVPYIEGAQRKQFLYIDAGHNPFGVIAKRQVAQMLLDICHAFPDYDLVVKPRWLRGEQTKQTHRSGLHIYSVLEEMTEGKLPENLVLLNEHKNLQELIDQSVSVITTSINCWIDAACRGKGCLVVDGFDSERQFETWPTFRDSYEVAEKAGCRVKYSEVINYLPKGLDCNRDYFQHRIPYSSGVSGRIVNVMEYTYDKFLRAGKYPAIKEYNYETFQEDVSCDSTLSINDLKYNRFKNAICGHACYSLFEYIGGNIDITPYFEYGKQIYRDYPLTREGFRRLRKKMIEKRREIVIDHREICMKDDISQSILFMLLLESGRESEILSIPRKQILCPGPFHYSMAVIASEQNDISKALEHFTSFLREANGRTFNKYPQENDWGIRNAYNYIFDHFNGKNIKAAIFADLYFALYEQRDMTVASYPSRQRAHNMLPKVAGQLANADPERALKCLRLYAKWEYHYNIRPREEQIEAMGNSKFYQFEQKLRRIKKKLKGGVKCYQEHGIRYTFGRIREKAANKYGVYSVVRIWINFCVNLDDYKQYAQRRRQSDSYDLPYNPKTELRLHNELVHQMEKLLSARESASAAGEGRV